MAEYHITTEQLKEFAPTLNVRDRVYLSGVVYTSRDAAHKRIFEYMEQGKELPFRMDGAVIYYAGPTPAKPGMAIGSCGPTTSSRMDRFAPKLLDMGLAAMVGKGERNQEVIDSIIRNQAVYLCAIGGAGALACKHITSCKVIAFDDLGCESVKELIFDEFPLTVTIDCHGGNIFEH
ncbi:FumA C-terminus/TtdB family hydratase beta subunit [Clostridium facile]|uniref:Fumarate hydratase C-terminal domain-containing protein n=1 Tax=Clostridium facile TaxID=2763035 RepID=A0ABR7INE3_9CLOT|nr:FumA C-terminus/TtdB family hydratase beta subunit [Clostridium facile]MBC5786618.1 fumarate hydratase C-terminal domain-containing protein [Clostridium facile]